MTVPSHRNVNLVGRRPGLIRMLGDDITNIGTYGIFAGLAVIYFWFGGMKFTAYEAEGLVPLVGNSPILSWMYDIFSVRGFSTLLGFIELAIGLLIAGRIVSPILSAFGGLLSVGLFMTTLSFMISTPGVFEQGLGFPAISVAPGQFLLKDIGLLMASLFVLGHSLSTIGVNRLRSLESTRSINTPSAIYVYGRSR